MLPTVIVSAATTATTGLQKSTKGPNGLLSTSSRPATPAAFDTTDRYAATGTGAPAYVSGTHMWKGTAPILNTNPARVRITPVRSTASGPAPAWTRNRMSSK